MTNTPQTDNSANSQAGSASAESPAAATVPTVVWEQLLPLEESLLANGLAPITTFTWLHAPVDIATLRERAALILFENPWLVGKMEKKNGKMGVAYAPLGDMDQARKAAIETETFRTFSAGQIRVHPDQQWETQYAAYEKNPGVLLQPKDEWRKATFWKVSVIPTDDDKYIGLAVSLSHVIGDGHTFYTLYGALLGDKDAKVPQLVVKRNMKTTEMQEKFFGKQESKIMAAPGMIGTTVRGLFGKLFFAGWYPKDWTVVSKTYVIDNNKIDGLKKDTKLSFVSTNDVVSSWFLQQCDNGVIAMNMRGKLEGHSDDLAGNYENCLYLRRVDAATPDLVRQAIHSGKRQVTTEQPYSNWDVSGRQMGIVTNWVSLYPDKQISSVYKTHRHGPIANFANQVPPTIAACVIFRSSDDTTSVLIAASPATHARLDASLIAMYEANEAGANKK